MQRFDYIAVFDTDEMIVPIKHNSWQDMMNHIRKDKSLGRNRGSWSFKSYFFDTKVKSKDETVGIPDHFPMMKTINRYPINGKEIILSTFLHISVAVNTKSILNPNEVKFLGSHNALECLSGPCDRSHMSSSIAITHHYRNSCPPNFRSVCEVSSEVVHIKE